MQKRLLLLSGICSLFLVMSSCSKDDDNDNPPQTTNTQLLTKAMWKFDKAEASGVDVTSQLPSCVIDNTITFTSTEERKGTGIADEGASKCGASQNTSFSWTLNSAETTLTSDKPLFSGGSGDFTIVSLTETTFVSTQMMTVPGFPAPMNVKITMKH